MVFGNGSGNLSGTNRCSNLSSKSNTYSNASNGSGGSQSGGRKKKSRRQTGSTEKPKTPWFSNGVPSSLSLSAELDAFACLVKLTQQEQRRRDGLLATVNRLVQQHLSKATISLTGSYGCGLSSPSSGVDILIENCDFGVMSQKINCFSVLGKVLLLDHKEEEVVLMVEALNGVQANLYFRAQRNEEQHALSAKIKNWLEQYPVAGTVLAVVRHVLAQACAELVTKKGGLSPVAILAMVVHVCHRSITKHDAGEVLLAFLERYSKEVDFSTEAINPDTANSIPRVDKPDAPEEIQIMLSLPNGGLLNLAKDCLRLKQIIAHIRSCHIALRQFDPRRDSHTALSTVVSHQPLWKRAPQGPVVPVASQSGSNSGSMNNIVLPNGVVPPMVSVHGNRHNSTPPAPVEGMVPLGIQYQPGQFAETLRSDGTWAPCRIVEVDIPNERITVQGRGFMKKISFSNSARLRPAGGPKPVSPIPQRSQSLKITEDSTQQGLVYLPLNTQQGGVTYVPCVIPVAGSNDSLLSKQVSSQPVLGVPVQNRIGKVPESISSSHSTSSSPTGKVISNGTVFGSPGFVAPNMSALMSARSTSDRSSGMWSLEDFAASFEQKDVAQKDDEDLDLSALTDGVIGTQLSQEA